MNDTIEIKGMKKTFGSFTLGPIDLEIHKGAITLLSGPNNSGKTTLLKCICGQYIAETKTSETDCLSHLTKGLVFDECPFPEKHRIKELAQLLSRLYPDWDGRRFSELCVKFQLNKEKRIGDLSKGSRMKLQVAVCLSHSVDLLILDEYSSGLDEQSKTTVIKEIKEYLNDSRAIMIATHDTSNIHQYADYIVLMKDGKVVIDMDIPSLQDAFGIVRASELDSACIKEHVVAYQNNGYGRSYLVRNKRKIQEDDDNIKIETASVQDILSFLSGGAADE